jgi:hypothetical protein
MRTRRTMMKPGLTLAALVAAQALTCAEAAQFDYQASLAAGHSDNIRRTETNPESEDIAAAGVRFSFDQQSQRLNADIFGDLAYNDYLGNTYDSELIGNVIADVRYAFVPERFEWVLADNFGQVLGDPFLPATPDNRENLNYLVTGPDFTLPLGSQMRLRIGGRYALTTYEKSPFDSDSLLGELGLIRLLSSSSAISLNARAQQVQYDDKSLNADYDVGEAFLRYEAQGARTQLRVDAGYSEIDRDAVDQKQDGPILRLEIIRRISASSTVTIGGGREFSGAGDAFAVSQSGSGASLGTAPGRQTTEPFQNDFARIAWDFSQNRTTFTLSAAWADRTYELEPTLDQTITDAAMRVRRELSQTTWLMLEAGYERAEYAQPGGNYNDLLGGVSFGWRLSRVLTLATTYSYANRSSEFPGGDYTDNRIWLSLSYGRGLPRVTRATPQFGLEAMTH